jgi:hypothetical protein
MLTICDCCIDKNCITCKYYQDVKRHQQGGSSETITDNRQFGVLPSFIIEGMSQKDGGHDFISVT